MTFKNPTESYLQLEPTTHTHGLVRTLESADLSGTPHVTRKRHSVQTEAVKTEGQRRKVSKGIPPVVVGGVWLGWCMTAGVKQGENLGGGSSGWLLGEVTERTLRTLKLDPRTFRLGRYVLCIHDTLQCLKVLSNVHSGYVYNSLNSFWMMGFM